MKSRTGAASIRWSGIRFARMFFAALLMLMMLGGCQHRAGDKHVERTEAESKKAPAQITIENGQALITLDEATQKRLGFTVATLASTVARVQGTYPAVVLSVQELATFRNTYVASLAQLQRARVQADIAGKEYARLKALFGENQNISEKSLQSAEAALELDGAEVRAGEQQLNLQASSLRQEWGDVVAKWATGGSARFQRILDGEEALVQLTLPSESTFAPPKSISLELPNGRRSQATFISASRRIDPRIQGRSFLYLASGMPGLVPGLNLVARISSGSPLRGVVVPASAVVWSEGKAWVYKQVSSDGFTRNAVTTDVPVEDGYFAGEGLAAGEKIVTVGAQALLSEEMLLHGKGEGDGN